MKLLLAIGCLCYLSWPCFAAGERPVGELMFVGMGRPAETVTQNQGPQLTFKQTHIYGAAGSRPGELMQPTAVASGFGGMYVVDSGNGRIQKMDVLGNFLFQFGDSGTTAGGLEHPVGIAIDNTLHVYVTEALGHRISRFTDKGTFETSFGSFGLRHGELNTPAHLCVDGDGNLWVADSGNDRIEEFSRTGEFKQVIGAYGQGMGYLNKPLDVAVDRNRRVWVADSENHRIQRFNQFGQFELAFGAYGTSLSEFNRPVSLAVDWDGWIYVLDAGNQRVQVYDDYLRFAGTLPLDFKFGQHLAVDRDQLCIVDGSNGRILVYNISKNAVGGNTMKP